jgi:hypothetical protein
VVVESTEQWVGACIVDERWRGGLMTLVRTSPAVDRKIDDGLLF